MTVLAKAEELTESLIAEGVPGRQSPGATSRRRLNKIDAYWRACNYLALGMIYLQANPLLREPSKSRAYQEVDSLVIGDRALVWPSSTRI